jgi:uncharacterized protein involved in oxidation of intracellular sulfur
VKIGIVISTNDPETVWNALRFGNFSLRENETVKIFLLGKGVEGENLPQEKFDIKKEMRSFVEAGGQIYACGTCLKIRDAESTELCPVSTMKDLYEIIKEADKIVTF